MWYYLSRLEGLHKNFIFNDQCTSILKKNKIYRNMSLHITMLSVIPTVSHTTKLLLTYMTWHCSWRYCLYTKAPIVNHQLSRFSMDATDYESRRGCDHIERLGSVVHFRMLKRSSQTKKHNTVRDIFLKWR